MPKEYQLELLESHMPTDSVVLLCAYLQTKRNISSTLPLDCGGRIHFAFISMASLGILVGLGFLVVQLASHSTENREDVSKQVRHELYLGFYSISQYKQLSFV